MNNFLSILLFFKNFNIKSETMNVFLVDLTHGGVKISSELAKSKKYEKVFAYDLYNTLKKEDESLLNTYNVHIIKDLDNFKNELENNAALKSDKTEKETRETQRR